MRSIVISDRVSVPVLSLQMTEAEPSVSTEDSFLTMALSADRRCTPTASTTDSTAGKPSGTAATASDTPNSSTVISPCSVCTSPSNNSVAITSSATAITPMPSMRPSRATSFCSGVSSSCVLLSRWAIWPISVRMPVAVTSARPLPPATAVPLNTILMRSPSATGSASVIACFSTASLSPVSEASCTRSVCACSRRASAPTASPSASSRMSPGTSELLGMRCGWPSRCTVTMISVIRASAAAAFSALLSCRKPSRAFSSTTAVMTMASTGQPAKSSSAQTTIVMAMAASSR